PRSGRQVGAGPHPAGRDRYTMTAAQFPVFRNVEPLRVRDHAEPIHRAVPEEQPVAIVCNGTTLAVMMATPADLEDFGVGYLISEGVIVEAAQVARSEVVQHEQGIELRHWLSAGDARAMLARRRQMVGPTGCGLCGIESLEQAARPLPRVASGFTADAEALRQAVAGLRDRQELNALTRGVHAAAVWSPASGYRLVREDVGRHNALGRADGRSAR